MPLVGSDHLSRPLLHQMSSPTSQNVFFLSLACATVLWILELFNNCYKQMLIKMLLIKIFKMARHTIENISNIKKKSI